MLTVTATDGQGRVSRDTYAFHVAATALPPSGGSGGGGGGGGTTPAPPANATAPAPAPAPADAPAPSSSPSEDTHTTDASQALRGPLGALLRTKLPVAALLRKGHAVVRFSAPGPGKITVRWMVGDPHALDGRVILAAATGRASAGTVRLTVHITSAGRRILGRAQRPIQVLAGATFSGAGAAMTTLFAPVSVSRS